ncbi:hypothetical protein CLV44_1204 [Marinobacterium halophilum]|uniref:Uncharacterized protein n=1 Tax=Marinobacterium halophilum TaxID=267374 RepID=A0A2P8ERB6_9GAMM|nr:hypothetical protein [Marinobacterium halophilum]PSL12020.1 hypothetical protein CLV44_1204 [Marinobacterium halophilum]
MIQGEEDFIGWLDGQLNGEIPDNIIAFNLNIYESPFKIEIVGSNEFDREDEDWACNEDWVPQNRTISVSTSLLGDSWEETQSNLIAMAQGYLKSDASNVSKLRKAKAFAVGFVDGNLCYVK